MDDAACQVATELNIDLPLHGLTFARAQLENCSSNVNHGSRCQPQHQVEDSSWPKRILCISEGLVRLVDFDASTMAGHYTALSYCWGSQEELERRGNLTTTKQTYDNHVTVGIPIEELPLTIRQAVGVTRYLGHKYIWVDALCILQDDSADWDVESLKMATVYTMAAVTIIAASSTSCHSGFLPIQPPEQSPEQLQRQLRYDVALPGHIALRAVWADYLPEGGFHNFPDPCDPLEQRGWTYQEEYLSSRYLKFTSDDIQWRCNAGAVCLCGAEIPDGFGDDHPNLKTDGTIPWEIVVRGFSGRQFTKYIDKLPAISGLAKNLAAAQREKGGHSKYIAGCWHDRIMSLKDIVWYPEYGDKPAEDYDAPMPYIAPSFTWPSINTRVVFPNLDMDRDIQPLCEVIGIDIRPVSAERPFGCVAEGGKLIVRGPLITGCVLQVWPPNMNRPGEVSQPRFQVKIGQGFSIFSKDLKTDGGYIDCRLSECLSSTGTRTLHRCPGIDCPLSLDTSKCHRPSDLRVRKGGSMREVGEVDVVLLMVRKNSKHGAYVTGLVLGRAHPDSHVYQRIGIIGYRVGGLSEFLERVEAGGLEPWVREITIQ